MHSPTPMRTLVVISLILILSFNFAWAQSKTDSSQPKTFTIYDKESGESHKVQVAQSSAHELRNNSPSKVHARSLNADPCSGIISQVNHEYISEKIFFDVAVGLSAKNLAANDPGKIYNFLQHSIMDPAAYISFYFFMLGNRGAMALMRTIGIAHNPCSPQFKNNQKAILKIRDQAAAQKRGLTKAETKQIEDLSRSMQMNPLQERMKPFLSPIGMAVGMTLSSLTTELLKDPNLHACAKGYLQPKGRNEAAHLKACDKAYEDWAVSKKIMDYAPDMIAMTLTVFMQGALNAQILKLAKTRFSVALTPLSAIFRGLQVTWAGGWVVKGVVTVANLTVFLFITDFITTPLIKGPWNRWRYGNDLVDKLEFIDSELKWAEKNKWEDVLRPKPAICDQISSGDVMLDPESLMGYGALCTMEPGNQRIQKVLSKFGELNQQWRQVIISDATTEQQNWLNYLSYYVTLYNNSYRLYKIFAEEINFVRLQPHYAKAPPGLYQPNWQRGIDPLKYRESQATFPHPEDDLFQISEIDPLAQAKKVQIAAKTALPYAIQVYKTADRYKFSSKHKSDFFEILIGLSAIDETIPLEETLRAFKILSAKELALDQDLVTAHLYKADQLLRTEQFITAMNKLKHILKHDPQFKINVEHIQPGDIPFFYTLAEVNPFLKIRLLLGDPKPVRPGVAYLEALENNEQIILPETRDKHPKMASALLDTPSMTDYLLSQMVCGPEAAPSQEQKIRIYQDQQRRWYDGFLGLFGFRRNSALPSEILAHLVPGEPTTDIFMNQVEAAAQHAKYPPPSIFPWGRTGLVEQEADYSTNLLYPGWWATFNPPKIADVPFEACKTLPANIKTHFEAKKFMVHEGEWTFKDQKFHGFLDLVKKFARPEVVGTSAGEVPFTNWWKINVDPFVTADVTKYKNKFLEIIEKKFVPELARQDYCEVKTSPYLPNWLANSDMLVFGALDANCWYKKSDVTKKEVPNSKSFARGVGNSMLDEMRYYLGLIGRIHFSKPVANDRAASEKIATKDTYVKLSQTMMQRLELGLKLFGRMDQVREAILEIEELGRLNPSQFEQQVFQKANEILAAANGADGDDGETDGDTNDDDEGSASEAQQASNQPKALPHISEVTSYWHPRAKEAFRTLQRLLSQAQLDLMDFTGQQVSQKKASLGTELITISFTNMAAILTDVNSFYGVINAIDPEELGKH